MHAAVYGKCLQNSAWITQVCRTAHRPGVPWTLVVTGEKPAKSKWFASEAVDATKLSQLNVVHQIAGRGDQAPRQDGIKWLGRNYDTTSAEIPTKKQRKD